MLDRSRLGDSGRDFRQSRTGQHLHQGSRASDGDAQAFNRHAQDETGYGDSKTADGDAASDSDSKAANGDAASDSDSKAANGDAASNGDAKTANGDAKTADGDAKAANSDAASNGDAKMERRRRRVDGRFRIARRAEPRWKLRPLAPPPNDIIKQRLQRVARRCWGERS